MKEKKLILKKGKDESNISEIKDIKDEGNGRSDRGLSGKNRSGAERRSRKAVLATPTSGYYGLVATVTKRRSFRHIMTLFPSRFLPTVGYHHAPPL